MKKCPKCGQAYDDSWKVCLSCSVNLSDDLSIKESDPELRNKASEKRSNLVIISLVLIIIISVLGILKYQENSKITRAKKVSSANFSEKIYKPSYAKMMKDADIVIRGKVLAVDPTDTTFELGWARYRTVNATVKIIKALKGPARGAVIVEFSKIEKLPDGYNEVPVVYHTNLKVGEKRTFYLKKLWNDYYAIVPRARRTLNSSDENVSRVLELDRLRRQNDEYIHAMAKAKDIKNGKTTGKDILELFGMPRSSEVVQEGDRAGQLVLSYEFWANDYYWGPLSAGGKIAYLTLYINQRTGFVEDCKFIEDSKGWTS